MAIIKNIAGTSIRIPGAYSQYNVRQTGGLPLSENGIVGIIGEATHGAPGDVSGITEYDSSTLVDLINYYKSGPIVDAAKVLVNASNDKRVQGSVGRMLVWKTNNSTQAAWTLGTGWGTVTSQNYGSNENQIAVKIDQDTPESWSLGFNADWTTTPGSDLLMRINGGTVTTITAANCTSAANTVTELNSKINTALGTSGIVYASTATNRISLNLMAAGTGAPRAGMGICVEFIASSEWADIGVTTPQQGVALAAGVAGAVSISAYNATRSLEVTRSTDGSSETTDSSTGELGGKIYMEIGSVAATSCVMTISSTTLTLNATGSGAGDISILLSYFTTLNDLAEYINTQTGYVCSIPADINGALPPSVLDRVTTVGICSSTALIKPGKLKADAFEVQNWFDLNSALTVCSRTSFLGLPDVLVKTFLGGGSRGGSTTSNFDDGFTAFEGVRLNTIIPLVSQDAANDLSEDPDYTYSGSTYDVESIHNQARAHCKKMSNVQNRSERDAYVGYRGTFTECKNQAKSISSEFVSMLIQDAQVLDAQGELNWKQPHIAACLVAGIQAGSEVGTPATYKFLAANGIRHLKKAGDVPTTTEDFKFGTVGHKNQAIDNGITPLEAPSSGGIRVVVHNTTYQADANFVFNRKHVLETVNYIAYNLRQHLENVFVGEKAKTGNAESIKNFVIAEMDQFRKEDLIVGDDNNAGLGYRNLVVTITGNTAVIDVVVTPVQGLDFVIARLEIADIKQTA